MTNKWAIRGFNDCVLSCPALFDQTTLEKLGQIILKTFNSRHFHINRDLLKNAQRFLSSQENLYWIVGGAGSGKTTICEVVANQFDIPVYDMDSHIYGKYHSLFTQENHPVNKAWSTASNGLAWLLDMTWDDFNRFNQAALPEYLDLFLADLATVDPSHRLLIDGGICNPGLLAQAFPAERIVCLARPERTSVQIWEENEERRTMKEFIYQLPNPESAWEKFLEFDRLITLTILEECQGNNIPIISRAEEDSVDDFAEKIIIELGIK